MHRRQVVAAVSALSLITATTLLIAGPLNPPAGPVAQTYKTIAEVEPRIAINAANTPGDGNSVFRITSPGSYYLTGQVAVSPEHNGIEVAANDVTIDLNGYRIGGYPGALSGIATTYANPRNLTIVNGSISGFSTAGITVSGTSGFARGLRVERVTVRNCTGGGIQASECDLAVIDHVVAQDNGTFGVAVRESGQVSDCIASGNGQRGIIAGAASAVRHCTAQGNAMTGIYVTQGTIEHCDAAGSLTGISAASSVVRDCRVSQCSSYGIETIGSGSVVEGNSCQLCDIGVRAFSAGNWFAGNVCRANGTSWNVTSGNVCFIVAASTCPVINSESGGTPPGTFDPRANFSY